MIRNIRRGKWHVGSLSLFAIGSLSFEQAQELLTALPPRSFRGPRLPTTELWVLGEKSTIRVSIDQYVPKSQRTTLVVEPEPMRDQDGTMHYYMTVGALLWGVAREYRRIAVASPAADLQGLEVSAFTMGSHEVAMEITR